MKLRCASWNVLADDYINYGTYGEHVPLDLLEHGVRVPYIIRTVRNLKADIIGLQEVDRNLMNAFKRTREWQEFWLPKEHEKPDGCLTLVRKGINITGFDKYAYGTAGGHVFQIIFTRGVAFVNTHIQYDQPNRRKHVGVIQTEKLLDTLKDMKRVVVFADCNDRPGRTAPVRALFNQAGFINTFENEYTALIDGTPAAIDLLAIRGLKARSVKTGFSVHTIPSTDCPSDHIPIVAEVEMPEI
jgi:endonuclease/exonuclease/phosphatase family metal-dependent hydrolase